MSDAFNATWQQAKVNWKHLGSIMNDTQTKEKSSRAKKLSRVFWTLLTIVDLAILGDLVFFGGIHLIQILFELTGGW